MVAYRWVYDSRHLQADCMPRTRISSGTIRLVIEYGLTFFNLYITKVKGKPCRTHEECRRGAHLPSLGREPVAG